MAALPLLKSAEVAPAAAFLLTIGMTARSLGTSGYGLAVLNLIVSGSMTSIEVRARV
jgi:hypothetical protein